MATVTVIILGRQLLPKDVSCACQSKLSYVLLDIIMKIDSYGTFLITI